DRRPWAARSSRSLSEPSTGAGAGCPAARARSGALGAPGASTPRAGSQRLEETPDALGAKVGPVVAVVVLAPPHRQPEAAAGVLDARRRFDRGHGVGAAVGLEPAVARGEPEVERHDLVVGRVG